MASLREILKTIVDVLLVDVQQHHIFNEADMQSRLAQHLAKCCGRTELRVRNQPFMHVGQRRGRFDAKPDIVITDRDGPIAALELKCFLDRPHISPRTIAQAVLHDTYKLDHFKRRYRDSRNAFVVAIMDLPDIEDYLAVQRMFTARAREPWMSHYFFPHLINVFCDEHGRKRRWYDDWSNERDSWIATFDKSKTSFAGR